MHWVLNFKVHQTCTGTKKINVLNFKVHQTCTGTKKTKTSQSTWEGATIPLKFLYFFCFFCPCAGLVDFEVQNFCFFCPCAGLVHFKLQNICFFLSLCRFCAFYSLNLLFVLCLWRFGVTHGLLSKCIISQGIGIVCLNVMFFHCCCRFPDSGFFQNNTI